MTMDELIEDMGSIAAVAMRLGVSVATVDRYRTGKTRPASAGVKRTLRRWGVVLPERPQGAI